MGGIVSCVDPKRSIASNSRVLDSTDEEISSHSKNVQYHRPTYLGSSDESPLYNLLLLGFGASGKTSLITRNAKQLFYKNYIPSVLEERSYITQIVNTQERNEVLVRVQVTDIPGSFLGKQYYNKSLCDLIRTHDGIIVTIDSTKSFGEVKQELEKLCTMVDKCVQEHSDMKKEYSEYQGHLKCIIIALTKVDLVSKVQVSIDQVQGFLDTRNFNFSFQSDIRLVETSALYGINIFVLFKNLVQMCQNSRTGGISKLYDFWKHPMMAESVLESWGINDIETWSRTKMSSNQQKTESNFLPQQEHSNQQSKIFFYQHDQPHQINRQITISSPATVMDSPSTELLPESMKQESTMCRLSIGRAALDSCPVQDMSISGSTRNRVAKHRLTAVQIPPKPVLTMVSHSSDDVVKYSPSNTTPMSEEHQDSIDCTAYAWTGITEHRRSVSSVVSMIEDKDSAKEPESCKEMERRLASYREKMMEAKEKNQFAVANMYKQEVIKCQLLLSETRNRTDRSTNLLNRNAFDEDITVFEQICESMTPGLKSLVFAIDLMNFKLLNDEHGHVNGDRALRWFARALKRLAKKMEKVSGKAWKVYRVGGDEFAITALVGKNDRELFRSAAQCLSDIHIPWVDLVSDCTSEAAIFARIGGVYGKSPKYEDADIIERNVKERNKNSRKTLMRPEKIDRVLLYYLDADDRNAVIAEYEKEIEAAAKMREFSRCTEIQEYIKFLQEGFLALKKENLSDMNEDPALLREDTLLRGDTTLYTTNAFQRLTKKSNLQEIYDITETERSESSVRPIVSPKRKNCNPSSPGLDFEETKKNNKSAENEDLINRREVAASSPAVEDDIDQPPPYISDSEKEGNVHLNKPPQPTHMARPSQSMSEVSVELFTRLPDTNPPVLQIAK